MHFMPSFLYPLQFKYVYELFYYYNLEIDLQLPGVGHIGGLWPAAWLLGNLGRATYVASTNLVWPWSTNVCDRKLQHAQELTSCATTSHYSLHPGQGRGATEIDLLEIMGGIKKLTLVETPVSQPFISMTLQVAPGIPKSKKRPVPGVLPKWGFHWYDNITYGANVSVNPFFYGNYLGPTQKNEPSMLKAYSNRPLKLVRQVCLGRLSRAEAAVSVRCHRLTHGTL